MIGRRPGTGSHESFECAMGPRVRRRAKRGYSAVMADWAIKVLVITFVTWVIWSTLQPRYAFLIRINDGRPWVRTGKVTPAFLVRVAEACRESAVGRGWIGGVLRGRRTVLKFSRQFPPRLRQRLRNEWQVTC